MEKILPNDLEEFKAKVSAGVVVVDFFAAWCGPCKSLAPFLEKLSASMSPQVTFYKMNTEEIPAEIVAEYGVNMLPTVLVFKDGDVVERLSGATKQMASLGNRLSEMFVK